MTLSNFAVEGGSVIEGLIGFTLAIATIVVGAWVAIVAYRGYTRSENPSTLYLAAGVALASAGYTTTRILIPTAGGSSLLTNAVAIAIQFVGLTLVLYAVYGRSQRRTWHVLGGAVVGGGLVLLVPFALVAAFDASLSVATAGGSSVTAVLGAFIGIQALRGYWRYGRQSMQWLAVGIVLLTVVPFLVLNFLTVFRPTVGVSDAVGLGLVLFTELIGVIAILVSLRIE